MQEGGMTKRRSITKAMRVRIFDAAKGLCHLCRLPINAPAGEKWEVEHVKALWEGGADAESNMAPAHVDCHATKSKAEATPRAKSTRQRARHIGATQPSGKLQGRQFEKAAKPSRNGAARIEKTYGPRWNSLTGELLSKGTAE
jgi:5-methylcytosine-specific restriction endonuclease McrA